MTFSDLPVCAGRSGDFSKLLRQEHQAVLHGLPSLLLRSDVEIES